MVAYYVPMARCNYKKSSGRRGVFRQKKGIFSLFKILKYNKSINYNIFNGKLKIFL
jgi:hypothetical protein